MNFHELDLGVPPDDVWAALVSADRHDWYYGLTPRGEFAAGSRITWVGADGTPAEESEVLDVEPGRRLRVRSRFVFAPALAEAPPHEIEWLLEPTDAGTRVRMSWTGTGPAIGMLESEGRAQLQGLRLEVDPAARAELARKETIGEVTVLDVTPDRLADYQAFFDHDAFRDYPAWQACYCMEPVFPGTDDAWAQRTAAENRRDVSELIAGGQLTALLAYEGGRPVGWCHYGLSTRLAGVMRRFGLEVAEHEGVGSIGCFIVAAPHRGHGIATRLLDTALERLRAAGCRAVEAYPPRDRTSPQGGFRGPLPMYLAAGFEPYRDEPDRPLIVRKQL